MAKWPLTLGMTLLLGFSCGDGESTLVGQPGSRPGSSLVGEGGVAGGSDTRGSAGAGGGDSGAPAQALGFDCKAPEGELGSLRLTPILTDVAEPVFAIAPPGDARRLFVVQRSGSVLLLKDGKQTPEPFLTVDVQWDYAEKGLLGLAFHPDYDHNGLFYVDYVATVPDPEEEGDLVVAEYQRDPENPDRALPQPRRELLRLPQVTAKHKAGTLVFDAEKRLYISVGNAGDSYLSANPGELYGKVLRIHPMPEAETYSIPRDNPLLDGWAPEVLEIGLRNPWRIAIDPCTSDLYIADVGSEDYEEVNISPAASGGHDYGFRDMEGYACNVDPDCDQTGRATPIGGYAHASGNCAIIGGFVYRGHAIPALRGAYLYGDLCSGRIHALRYADGEVEDEREITDLVNPEGIKGITSFGVDANGELYLMSRNERAVYRIEAE